MKKALLSPRILNALPLAFLICVSPLKSEARALTPEEAEASIESEITKVKIKSDGRVVSEYTTDLKILNESGRARYGTMRFNFSPKNEKFSIGKAEVRNESNVFKVKGEDIVETPLWATENGFDELRQTIISFPQVQVGSRLHYESTNQIHRPYLEGQHSERFFFGRDVLLKNSKVEIESERKLYLEINDPSKALQIQERQDKGKFFVTIETLKPVFHRVVDEVSPVLTDDLLTWVVISTESSYPAMFQTMAERYEKLLQTPLPEEFQKITSKAAKEKDTIAKLNFILSQLSENIRYMGDWRAVEGGFVPRSLEMIAATHYGDCKDMAFLTTRMLRVLGYEAHVAWVFRGSPPSSTTKVPYFSFNHAIVSVIADGKQFWLDPTNFQSFAQGVPEDIGERSALILNPKKLELRAIELTPPEANKTIVAYQAKFQSEDHMLVDVKYETDGLNSFRMTGNELRYSKEQIQESTISSMVDRTDLIRYQFGDMDLKGRIVKPIAMNWFIDRKYRPNPTSMGPGYTTRIPESIQDLNKLDVSNRKSHFYLGVPSETQNRIRVENFKIKGQQISRCEIRSPWLDYTYSLKAHSTYADLEVNDKVKKYWLRVSEMQSPEFLSFQKQLRKCGREQTLIYAVPKTVKGS